MGEMRHATVGSHHSRWCTDHGFGRGLIRGRQPSDTGLLATLRVLLTLAKNTIFLRLACRWDCCHDGRAHRLSESCRVEIG